GRIERIPSTGPVIGIIPSSRWQSTSLHLGPGDTLLLYSDGVTESPSSEGVEFGTEGIEQALPIPAPTRSARAMADIILSAVDRHTGGERMDDLTMLVVKRPAMP
ncbi:MAG: PP2C family protein-serine/threonine phosphatase, partial [Acidobacteriota bacterium]